jgi:hypothetical protein
VHLALLALIRRAPAIRVYETSTNRAQVERLYTLRRRVVAGVALCALLSVALLYQVLTTGWPGSAHIAGAVQFPAELLLTGTQRSPAAQR